jgi:hypothetical protein
MALLRIAVLLTVALVARTSAATTWHVDAAAPCPGAGTTASPFCNIQAALDAAAPGDEILVEPGTYFERLDFLGKDVELRSSTGAATTIVDARGLGSVVTFDGGESRAALLSGFTLRGGDGIFTDLGAGIHCDGSSPTIADNVVEGCFGSSSGGGMALLGGSPLVIGNVVQDNGADFGAGLYCAQGTTAQIVGNQIVSNGFSGTTGGGINVTNSAVLIEGNLIEGNRSSCCAGIYVDSNVQVVVRGNEIRGNFADEGGAGGLQSDPHTLVEDNVIADNHSYSDGAGVYAYGGTYRNNRITGNYASVGFTVLITNGASFDGDVIADNPGIVGTINANAMNGVPIVLRRVTIAGHDTFEPVLASFVGPLILEDCLIADNYDGLFVTGDATLRRCTLSGQDVSAVRLYFDGHVTLESCIVWDNGAGLVPDTGTIDATWSIVEGGWPGTGNSAADPLFANAAGGDWSLLPGSPAVDTGDAMDGVGGFDLAGTPRRLDGLLDVGSEVDRGALEFDNVKLATSSPGPGVLKIDLTGTAGLQTFLLAAPSAGSLSVEKWGTLGLNLSGPWLSSPWPGAPSTVTVHVAPAFAGVPLVLQALAGPPGQLGFTGNLSNAESIELP